MSETLKKSISKYLFIQSMIGSALSAVVLVVLIVQDEKWELWRSLYALIPAVGCMVIYLSAAATLRLLLHCELPPLQRKQRLQGSAILFLLVFLELVLYMS